MKLLTRAFAVLLFITVSAQAQAEPVTKEELGGLIKEYLKEHPEVIIEAVELYQEKAKEEGLKAARDAIKQNEKALFGDPSLPSIGDKDAKVTIVEFFDYNCSACKYMFNPIDKLYQAGLKDVRVVFMEYPIFGDQSEKLSKIALAVNALEPKKYYDFHAKMMKHKGSITVENAYAYAEEVGIKRDDIQTELSSPKYAEILKKHAELGNVLQIRGTPFLVVGGEPVPHALDENGLNAYIEKAKAGK